MLYVFVPLMLVVVAGLAWAWWAGRPARDPAGTVSSFHRALAAMQPDGPADPKEPVAPR